MDIYVLMSVCMLAEAVSATKNSLYQRTFYQNILFNFDIWSRSNFEVQRGKSGNFTYCVCEKNNNTQSHDGNLPHIDFIQKEIGIQELNAIITYAISCRQELQV